MDTQPLKPSIGQAAPIGLARQAYNGAPKPLGDNVLGQEALELSKPRPHWSYKSKKVRKQEILDSM